MDLLNSVNNSYSNSLSLESEWIDPGSESSFRDQFHLLPLLKTRIHSPWLSSLSSSTRQRLGGEWNKRIAPLFAQIGHNPKQGREKKKIFVSIGTYLQNVVSIMAEITRSDRSTVNGSLFCWAEVLYLTGLDRKKTISKSQNNLLQSYVSSYIESSKSSSTSKEPKSQQQLMIEQIAFDLIAHLSTHKLDPFNLFLGACPSESFSRSFRSLREDQPPSSPTARTPPLSSPRSSSHDSIMGLSGSLSIPPSPSLSPPLSSILLLPPAMKTDNTNTEEKENESPNVILGGDQIESSYIDLVMRWNRFLNFPDQILKEISVVAENVQKSQCWGTGCLVAVEVDALPPCQRKWFTNPNWKKVWDCRFVFCRIASHHLFKDHGGSVDIFVDPFERESIRVVASSVFTFDQKELDKELTVFNRKWFSRPSDFFFNRCVEIIEKTVNKFLCTDPNASKAKDLFHIEEAFKEHERRESLSGSSEFKSQIFEHLFQKTNEFLEEWVADVPHGLVCPPRLDFYGHTIDELLKSFPKMVAQEIESHMTFSKTRLQSFTKRLQMVINGSSKNFVCSWWLNHIHEETDQFLKKQGFDLEALPPDYTDTPPKDISIVERNQQILMELLKVDEDNGDRGDDEDDGDDEKRDGESKHSDESLDQFVDETVQRVYEKLDELMSEMEFVLQRGWENFILDEFRFEYSESDLDSLRKDYEYLKKVKAMDQQIKMEEKKGKEKKRVEMSEVVPVAGLVMARFHIYDCEISTALDLWGQRTKPILQKSESYVVFPAEYLSFAQNKGSNGASKMIEPEVSQKDEYSQMRQELCSFLQESSSSSSSRSDRSRDKEETSSDESGARGFLEFCLETRSDSPTLEDDLDQFENSEELLLSPEELIFGARSQPEATFVEEPQQQPISSPKKGPFFWKSPPPKKRTLLLPIERDLSFSNTSFSPSTSSQSPPLQARSNLKNLQRVSMSLRSQSSIHENKRHSAHPRSPTRQYLSPQVPQLFFDSPGSRPADGKSHLSNSTATDCDSGGSSLRFSSPKKIAKPFGLWKTPSPPRRKSPSLEEPGQHKTTNNITTTTSHSPTPTSPTQHQGLSKVLQRISFPHLTHNSSEQLRQSTSAPKLNISSRPRALTPTTIRNPKQDLPQSQAQSPTLTRRLQIPNRQGTWTSPKMPEREPS